MKTITLLFLLALTLVLNSCSSSGLSDLEVKELSDSVISLSAQVKIQDTSSAFTRFVLNDRLLNMKLRLSSHYYVEASEEMTIGIASSLAGTLASCIFGLATYDKDTKKISSVAFVPVAIGAVIAIINWFDAAKDFKRGAAVFHRR